jgi:hypothetical protein
MYPIYLLSEGTQLPDAGEYYVVAGNGIFFRKDTGLFTGYVKVDQISILEDLVVPKHHFVSNLPLIPHMLVMKVRRFFLEVFNKYHGEACVILCYNKESHEFLIQVPLQKVSHVHVDYKPEPITKPGFIPVGTIHSHCDFSAFHSGTDVHDETDFDGIHVTFGHINNELGISISCSVVLNGQRVVQDPLSCLENISYVADSGKSKLYKINFCICHIY